MDEQLWLLFWQHIKKQLETNIYAVRLLHIKTVFFFNFDFSIGDVKVIIYFMMSESNGDSNVTIIIIFHR